MSGLFSETSFSRPLNSIKINYYYYNRSSKLLRRAVQAGPDLSARTSHVSRSAQCWLGHYQEHTKINYISSVECRLCVYTCDFSFITEYITSRNSHAKKHFFQTRFAGDEKLNNVIPKQQEINSASLIPKLTAEECFQSNHIFGVEPHKSEELVNYVADRNARQSISEEEPVNENHHLFVWVRRSQFLLPKAPAENIMIGIGFRRPRSIKHRISIFFVCCGCVMDGSNDRSID